MALGLLGQHRAHLAGVLRVVGRGAEHPLRSQRWREIVGSEVQRLERADRAGGRLSQRIQFRPDPCPVVEKLFDAPVDPVAFDRQHRRGRFQRKQTLFQH